jgi:hypothetical protein
VYFKEKVNKEKIVHVFRRRILFTKYVIIMEQIHCRVFVDLTLKTR